MSTLDSPNFVEPANVSTRSIGVRYGAIVSLILIAIGLLLHVAGMTDYSNQYSAGDVINSVLTYGLIIGGLVMAMKKYRDSAGGYMTFGKGFNTGFWASLVMAVITAVWTYLFFAVIDPSLPETIMEATRDRMLEQGQSEEAVDQAMQYTEMFLKPGMMTIFAGIGILFTGVIISLIVAAIMQRKPATDSIA